MVAVLILSLIGFLFSSTPIRDFYVFRFYLSEEEMYEEFLKELKVKKNCPVEVGYASWYGPKFHGRRTANGEIFDLYKFTAASRTLPLGTYVLVYNFENGKFVVVRINDRGPYVKGRIIDLSFAAAYELGLYKRGLGKVAVIPLKCLSPLTQLRLYDKFVKHILRTY
ncbi:septal ring lytic transglycosylase RlpA family protein [Aquifex pyrophilus]